MRPDFPRPGTKATAFHRALGVATAQIAPWSSRLLSGKKHEQAFCNAVTTACPPWPEVTGSNDSRRKSMPAKLESETEQAFWGRAAGNPKGKSGAASCHE